jgi:hypothetical protein
MGARTIYHRKASVTHSRAVRQLAFIVAAVGLPMILAYCLVATDMRIDLSDLRLTGNGSLSGTRVVGWAEVDAVGPVARARMPGYMMDGDSPVADGTMVKSFVLMPEAGQFLHPAHCEPREMVTVLLHRGEPFRFRQLIWVTGRLDRAVTRGAGSEPLWIFSDATVEKADEREIEHLFRP